MCLDTVGTDGNQARSCNTGASIHPRGSTQSWSCSGTCFSHAQTPSALTSAEHQAQRGLTARHCLQELTPRVVQMLPPEMAKQREVTTCRAQTHTCAEVSVLSQQHQGQPSRAELCSNPFPDPQPQVLPPSPFIATSPAQYQLDFIWPRTEHHFPP